MLAGLPNKQWKYKDKSHSKITSKLNKRNLPLWFLICKIIPLARYVSIQIRGMYNVYRTPKVVCSCLLVFVCKFVYAIWSDSVCICLCECVNVWYGVCAPTAYSDPPIWDRTPAPAAAVKPPPSSSQPLVCHRFFQPGKNASDFATLHSCLSFGGFDFTRIWGRCAKSDGR